MKTVVWPADLPLMSTELWPIGTTPATRLSPTASRVTPLALMRIEWPVETERMPPADAAGAGCCKLATPYKAAVRETAALIGRVNFKLIP